jgi:hypothetical protein
MTMNNYYNVCLHEDNFFQELSGAARSTVAELDNMGLMTQDWADPETDEMPFLENLDLQDQMEALRFDENWEDQILDRIDKVKESQAKPKRYEADQLVEWTKRRYYSDIISAQNDREVQQAYENFWASISDINLPTGFQIRFNPVEWVNQRRSDLLFRERKNGNATLQRAIRAFKADLAGATTRAQVGNAMRAYQQAIMPLKSIQGFTIRFDPRIPATKKLYQIGVRYKVVSSTIAVSPINHKITVPSGVQRIVSPFEVEMYRDAFWVVEVA